MNRQLPTPTNLQIHGTNGWISEANGERGANVCVVCVINVTEERGDSSGGQACTRCTNADSEVGRETSQVQ